MELVFILLPAALALSALALAAFFWSASSGQYEDLEGPRWRVLMEDEP